MSNPVFLCDLPSDLSAGAIVHLAGDEGRHAAVVRRIKLGEIVDLCNGEGVRATGTVCEVKKESIFIQVETVENEPLPELQIVVVQAVAKGDRAELAVEMLTEVGVDVVVPWRAHHSVVKWDNAEKALERWRRTMREATKQSRRAWMPFVEGLQSSEAICELIAAADLAVVLHESADQSLANITVPKSGQIVLVIGPEGGISQDELLMFGNAGAKIAQMGPSVMRTSTAGAVATAVISSGTSRWAG